MLYIVMHLIACAWIYVGEHHKWGSWLANKNFNIHEFQHDAQTVYITSLYWVVTTLTTVGYGDIYGTT